jgi:hypothetical protein
LEHSAEFPVQRSLTPLQPVQGMRRKLSSGLELRNATVSILVVLGAAHAQFLPGRKKIEKILEKWRKHDNPVTFRELPGINGQTGSTLFYEALY